MSDKSISDLQRENAKLRKEIEQLRAQPARQVGEDEREEFEAWAKVKYPTADRKDSLGGFARDLRKSALEGWNARAALAPAAVAVVMPDGFKLVPIKTTDEMNAAGVKEAGEFHHCRADAVDDIYAAMIGAAPNARLNRRAIPVELLKKQYDRIDYAAAMNDTHAVKALTNELRALLGKEGE